jgi:TolB-like protein/DNA-binding winged helix-turn-helix (wHTH) protein/Flp pilus assembly protein TadD
MPLEIRFDGWTLRTDSGELTRDGSVTRLQEQPLLVLIELLSRPGELVTREQLISRLWPKGVVDFETGLNTVVRKLRVALGDDATTPKYIETIPRRGYRFIGQLEPERPTPEAEPAPPRPPPPPSSPPPSPSLAGSVDSRSGAGRPSRRLLWLVLGAALLLAVAFGAWHWLQPREPVARSLAVLPFKALEPEPADPALQLGMTDSLITQLSLIPDLRVSSLSAVRTLSGEDQDPVEAGRSLKVDAVLEGSLQVDEDRVRVSARLLKVSDGKALWAGEFNERLTDIFGLQDAVARKVVGALALRLSPEQSERLARRATTSTAAYQHYASGLYLWQQRRPEAVDEFEAALREDPGYVLAWSGLANALAAQGVYGFAPPRSVFPRAREAALEAVDLDPLSSEAHTALGQVLAQGERRWHEGEAQYREALRLDPGNATAWFRLAIVHAQTRRLDEAIDEIKRAQELEPLTLNHGANLGMFLYLKRDYAGARKELERILALDPGFDHGHAVLGRVLLAQGDAAAAIEQFRKQNAPVPGGDGDLGRAFARAGRLEEAQAEIARLEERSAAGYGVGYDLAGIHVALGDTARACEALRRGLTDHSQTIGFLPYEPAMDALRGEPCYAEAARELEAAAR